MVLKTFNLDGEIYKRFSEHCKKNGISMSKKVENFIRDELGRLRGRIKDKSKSILVSENKINRTHHSFSKYC